MKKQISTEKIKKLIERGFDLDLISFELEIPIETVKECKEYLEKREAPKQNESKRITEKNSYHYELMQRLRKKYNQLFYTQKTEQKIKTRQLTDNENEIIEEVISAIESKIEKIEKSSSKQESKKVVYEILTETRKIENYPLTLEQAEKICTLLWTESLNDVKTSVVDKVDMVVDRMRRVFSRCLATEISKRVNECEDIEELEVLEKKLTPEMKKQNEMGVGVVKSAIGTKINSLKSKQAMDKIKSIPENLVPIVSDLAEGELDIKDAKRIIDEEVASRVANTPKTRFSLTEEQHRKQVFMQIKSALTDKAEQFPIKKPEVTIYQIQELCGNALEIHTVMKNLIARKRYEEAKRFCELFTSKESDKNLMMQAISYKKEIRNNEISEFILDRIKNKGTFEEEEVFIPLLEKRLRSENIKLAEISLGRNIDGTRRISLADVWPEEYVR